MHNIVKTIAAKIPVLSFVLSVVVAWLLVPLSSGFPMVAFFLFFTCLSILVYAARKERSWFDTTLFIGILVLSCFLLLRANEVAQLINFFFIFLFGSILILPLTREYTLANLLFTPFYMMNEALTGRNLFPYSWSFLKKYNKSDALKGVFPSLVVTVLFLGITIPLLASANPFFNQLIQNALHFFNLSFLTQYFTADQFIFYAIRLMMFAFFAYIIPRILTASREGVTIHEVHMSLPVNYLIPKVAMGTLLLVFFMTQAQLYFATPDVLQSMGYTNSRLTNEVFFQATIVAFIIFFLAYLDKRRKTWNKVLTYVLIVEAFFLVGIAFKSVFDYSALWGFTQKRLWGYATMSWLTGALLLFLYYYTKHVPVFRFFQIVITYTIIVLVGINITNFDYVIAHFSKARTQNGTDYTYLAKLSPDAHSYRETLDHLVTQIEKNSVREQEQTAAAYRLIMKIEGLQRKYRDKTPINSFNVSEYHEFLNVRNIDIRAYRKRLADNDQKYNQLEKGTPQQSSVEIMVR